MCIMHYRLGDIEWSKASKKLAAENNRWNNKTPNLLDHINLASIEKAIPAHQDSVIFDRREDASTSVLSLYRNDDTWISLLKHTYTTISQSYRYLTSLGT